jgi:hypothetical protein
MWFTVVGDITAIRTIAAGNSVRERQRLRKFYGSGRWRKLAGHAVVRLRNGSHYVAELHWYEAHGLGQREIKVKRLVRPIA